MKLFITTSLHISEFVATGNWLQNPGNYSRLRGNIGSSATKHSLAHASPPGSQEERTQRRFLLERLIWRGLPSRRLIAGWLGWKYKGWHTFSQVRPIRGCLREQIKIANIVIIHIVIIRVSCFYLWILRWSRPWKNDDELMSSSLKAKS